jgi:hypothetical protein
LVLEVLNNAEVFNWVIARKPWLATFLQENKDIGIKIQAYARETYMSYLLS